MTGMSLSLLASKADSTSGQVDSWFEYQTTNDIHGARSLMAAVPREAEDLTELWATFDCALSELGHKRDLASLSRLALVVASTRASTPSISRPKSWSIRCQRGSGWEPAPDVVVVVPGAGRRRGIWRP